MRISNYLLSVLILVISFFHITDQMRVDRSTILEKPDYHVNWGYRKEPDIINYVPSEDWNKVNSNCAGYNQSPIDINFGFTQYNSTLPLIKLKRNSLDKSSEIWIISNNGHSVQLKSNKVYRFMFDLNNFEFRQMHFHWRGSEHTVNGHHYESELHLVHDNMNESGTYAVISFLFQLEDTHNSRLDPIINSLKNIRKYSSEYKIENFQLESLIPTTLSNYFTYSGSLTTPNCDEVVTWLVADKPVIGISENQLLEFQTLLDSNEVPILTNARPIQLVNNRVVKRSFYPFNTQRRSSSGIFSNSADRKTTLKLNLLFIFSYLLIQVLSHHLLI